MKKKPEGNSTTVHSVLGDVYNPLHENQLTPNILDLISEIILQNIPPAPDVRELVHFQS